MVPKIDFALGIFVFLSSNTVECGLQQPHGGQNPSTVIQMGHIIHDSMKAEIIKLMSVLLHYQGTL